MASNAGLLVLPSWMSTYFSPSSDLGRMSAVSPVCSGQWSSVICTVTRALLSVVGWMSLMVPIFDPASSTSLPATRPSAVGKVIWNSWYLVPRARGDTIAKPAPPTRTAATAIPAIVDLDTLTFLSAPSCQSIPRGPSPEALKNWWTNSSSDSSISFLLPK